MSLMLSAIARATNDGTKPAQRSKVRAAIFSTRGRRSVLGTYSIKPDGDTTLRRYGVYRIVGGRLQFWKEIDG
jgi:ABC-type branched-subunit amino acid transport system substrate-binding protein